MKELITRNSLLKIDLSGAISQAVKKLGLLNGKMDVLISLQRKKENG